MSLRFASVFLLPLLLAACEVGPDYQQPEPVVPPDWAAQTSHAAFADIDHQWWLRFHDPVLAELIDRADAGNWDLKIATARIEQARAGTDLARAALGPSGDVKAAATREANQMAMPGGSGSSFASLLKKPFTVYEAGFDASWEIDIFGGNRRAEESADAQEQSARAVRDETRVSLRAEVARDYILARQYQAQLQSADAGASAAQKIAGIAQKRFAAGEAAQIDVAQAQAAAEQACRQIPPLREALAQTQFSLDALIGAQPGATRSLLGKAASIPVAAKVAPLAAPASVIAQRPDIRGAERNLAAATAQQGVAAAQFFPKLSLSGFFGALTTTPDALLRGGSESWAASGGIVWPILSYGQLSANQDAADARQKEALAVYQKTVLEALADVEKAVAAFTERQKSLGAAEAEAAQDARARAIAEKRYRGGLTAEADVLLASQTFEAAQGRLAQARGDLAQALVALYKSLGGGWR